MYFTVRYIDNDEEKVTQKINAVIKSIKVEFESINYGFNVLHDQKSLDNFFSELSAVDKSSISYISKKEKIMGNALNPNGAMYFNDVVAPSINANISRVTNVMTRKPNTAVCFQIIPTSFNDFERTYFQNCRTSLNYIIGQIRLRQGMQPIDPFMKTVADAFDYYCNAVNNQIAYCNCLVCDYNDSSDLLCNKVIELFENENEHTGALEATRINCFDFLKQDQFPISPWLMSNQLVYQERNTDFWLSKNAPTNLLRLKFLFTTDELKSVYKLPFDDGNTIGLEITKYKRNREKLQDSIISEDTFRLGIIQSSEGRQFSNNTHAGVPLKDFTMHGLIVGTPGSGKTYFSLGLLVQMWEKFNIPFLVVEPTKNEYRSLIDIIPELQVFTPGKSHISPFIINPFIPPKNVSVETYISSLMTAFKAAFSMPSPLPDIFLASINEVYNEYGWRLESTSDDPYAKPFGMYEFIRIFRRRIKSSDYKGDVKANIESAGVVRLISLIEHNSNIYDNIHTIPLEDLISKPTVIELNAINDKEQKSLLMAFVLSLICTYTKNNSNYGGGLKNLLLIDEAHVLLEPSTTTNSDNADSVTSTSSTIEDMIAEVRACGTSIIIADQSPEKVGKGIVGNTNIKVIFRLVEKTSKDIIKNAINLNDIDYERLAIMGLVELLLQAILHHGRLKTEPLKIKTYSSFTDKNFRSVITDKELAPLCHYWDNKYELLIPHMECEYNSFCKSGCDEFVKSNADFIATRIVNMYKSKVDSPDDMIKVLWNCNNIILELAKDRGLSVSPNLINCTKIKLLRKFLLSKSFDISKKDYQRILAHNRFLINKEGLNE